MNKWVREIHFLLFLRLAVKRAALSVLEAFLLVFVSRIHRPLPFDETYDCTLNFIWRFALTESLPSSSLLGLVLRQVASLGTAFPGLDSLLFFFLFFFRSLFLLLLPALLIYV